MDTLWMAVRETAPVLAFLPVILWQRRLQRRGAGVTQLKDATLRGAFAHTMIWSAISGMFFAATLAWSTGVLSGLLPKMPAWVPANAGFLPMVCAIFCATKAAYPPLQRTAPVQSQNGK